MMRRDVCCVALAALLVLTAVAAPGASARLPGTAQNVELVGKLKPTGRFGDVLPGQIADLSHKGDYAYLNSWRTQSVNRCNRGGVFVVDISDPANPKEVGFIASPTGTYPGEGSQVVALDTPSFKGDVLTINNEACVDPGSTPGTLHGGVTLVDVTNPLAPVVLAQGVGDVTPPATVAGVKSSPVHLVHSAFSWQAGQKAYTVMVDIQESDDVDILDITNPRAPQLVAELDLQDPDTQIGTVAGTAFGHEIFLHDMVVKEIGGKQIMLASYWDGGYVQLDVTDPTDVKVLGDTNFGSVDPLFPAFSPPEGNAHQAEFSRDDKYIVGADEDFSPFRGSRLSTATGSAEFAEPVDATVQISTLAGGALRSERVTYVGRACALTGTPVPDVLPAAPAPADADPGTRRVAVIQRGGCTFDEKVQAVEDAGWDAFVIFNDANRPDGDPLPIDAGIDDATVPGIAQLPGVFITRADALARIFPGGLPSVGGAGAALTIGPAFDGWGYAHLYDRATMAELDAWAVAEARDARFATGNGDLSIHEVATDPAADLAYVSYYHAGLRVVAFGDGKLTEVGRFVDEAGSNLWGVDVATDKQGGRLILASDRDYGLYVFRYTGPGAVQAVPPPPAPPPPPPPVAPPPPPPPPGAAPDPSSAFTFPASQRLTIVNRRAKVTIRVPWPGRVVASLRARFGRTTRTIASTTRTATRAGSLTLTFRLSASNARLLRRTLARRPSRRTSGTLRVSFTPTGGQRRTRNKSLSIGMR
jgi:hypothetical protein